MGDIIRLDQHTINKIAAGEVIERPASVVKELIENAIDAASTKIDVEISQGGKELIVVRDNGKGMTKEDALLCIEKHTTSKLSDDKNLFTINTLGFRGEALSSIAAIALTSIATAREDGLGISIECDQGLITSQEEKALNKGTTITVKDLFYNTPVRKKYLKETAAEYRKILNIVTRYALAFPDKQFSLKHNGVTVLDAPANDAFNNIVEILGMDIASSLIKVQGEKDAFSFQGYVGKPSLSRGDKSQIITFVNNRYVENDELKEMIIEAYHTMLNTQRYPVVILHFSFPHSMIDVNVHPTKKIIRFRNVELIRPYLIEKIKQMIYSEDLVPNISSQEMDNRVYWQQRTKEKHFRHKPRDSVASVQEKLVEIEPLKVQPDKKPTKGYDAQPTDFHIIGKIHKTFIVEETEKGMRLIDQHAAHERILYERIIQQYNNAQVEPQALLQPITMEVTPEESSLIQEYKIVLYELGFEVETFGGNTFLLRSIPNIMGKQLNKDFFFVLLKDIESVNKELSIEEKKHAWWARMACRAAEKAGDNLENMEMKKMLADLHQCEQKYTCPHGRPTMIDFTIHDLEKFFKRVR